MECKDCKGYKRYVNGVFQFIRRNLLTILYCISIILLLYAVILWSNNDYSEYVIQPYVYQTYYDTQELPVVDDVHATVNAQDSVNADSNYIFSDIKVADECNFNLVHRVTNKYNVIYEVSYYGDSIYDDLSIMSEFMESHNDKNVIIMVQDKYDENCIQYYYDDVITQF